MDWDTYFLLMADLVAIKSKDPSTKVGAVIVHSATRQVLSTGFNGFARGVADNPERYQHRPTKYALVVHGEMNAILHAARHGVSLEGSRLYVTHPTCNTCAQAIIQAGIEKVTIDSEGSDLILRDPWKSGWKQATTQFDESGIQYEFGIRTSSREITEHR